jgi:hypothetical protein
MNNYRMICIECAIRYNLENEWGSSILCSLGYDNSCQICGREQPQREVYISKDISLRIKADRILE